MTRAIAIAWAGSRGHQTPSGKRIYARVLGPHLRFLGGPCGAHNEPLENIDEPGAERAWSRYVEANDLREQIVSRLLATRPANDWDDDEPTVAIEPETMSELVYGGGAS